MKKVYIAPSTIVSQNYFCNSIIVTSAPPSFTVDDESGVWTEDEHSGTIIGVGGDAPDGEGSDSKRRNCFYD